MKTESVRALRDCVNEHGARIEFRPTGSGHQKALITLAGRTRFIILATLPRGPNRKRVLRDARRVLRELSTATASRANAGRTIPTSLRRPEQRFAATRAADAILRADARKQRAAAMPKLTTKKAAPPTTEPRH